MVFFAAEILTVGCSHDKSSWLAVTHGRINLKHWDHTTCPHSGCCYYGYQGILFIQCFILGMKLSVPQIRLSTRSQFTAIIINNNCVATFNYN